MGKAVSETDAEAGKSRPAALPDGSFPLIIAREETL